MELIIQSNNVAAALSALVKQKHNYEMSHLKNWFVEAAKAQSAQMVELFYAAVSDMPEFESLLVIELTFMDLLELQFIFNTIPNLFTSSSSQSRRKTLLLQLFFFYDLKIEHIKWLFECAPAFNTGKHCEFAEDTLKWTIKCASASISEPLRFILQNTKGPIWFFGGEGGGDLANLFLLEIIRGSLQNKAYNIINSLKDMNVPVNCYLVKYFAKLQTDEVSVDALNWCFNQQLFDSSSQKQIIDDIRPDVFFLQWLANQQSQLETYIACKLKDHDIAALNVCYKFNSAAVYQIIQNELKKEEYDNDDDDEYFVNWINAIICQ